MTNSKWSVFPMVLPCFPYIGCISTTLLLMYMLYVHIYPRYGEKSNFTVTVLKMFKVGVVNVANAIVVYELCMSGNRTLGALVTFLPIIIHIFDEVILLPAASSADNLHEHIRNGKHKIQKNLVKYAQSKIN